MKLTLKMHKQSHHALGVRICELAGLDTRCVSAHDFVVYRNHITYRELPPYPRRYSKGGKFHRTQRIIRNPLPTSAWKRLL